MLSISAFSSDALIDFRDGKSRSYTVETHTPLIGSADAAAVIAVQANISTLKTNIRIIRNKTTFFVVNIKLIPGFLIFLFS